MTDESPASAPQLAEPVLAPIAQELRTTSGAGLAAAALALALGVWMTLGNGSPSSHVPSRPEDLGKGVITAVDLKDPDAVSAAIAMLRTDEGTRHRIAAGVEAGRRNIGWIVVQDSMDPDGDTIAIESGGIVQQVVLAKAWIPVPVLLGADKRIGITALKDGEGGGITLALVTSGGPMPLRPLAPGEHIEVAAE
jgi:hypothetical protein